MGKTTQLLEDKAVIMKLLATLAITGVASAIALPKTSNVIVPMTSNVIQHFEPGEDGNGMQMPLDVFAPALGVGPVIPDKESHFFQDNFLDSKVDLKCIQQIVQDVEALKSDLRD